MPYDYAPFPYRRPPGLDAPEPRHPVVIVGAGPVGLAMALELANHGVPSVVVDDNDVVSVGSRAICWSKRSLEIFDRLGIAEQAVEKGVTWKVGRTFHGDREVFNFDLLPEDAHQFPAFVNLQQYYVEQYLAERALAEPLVDLRFKNRVTGVDKTSGRLEIETPDGPYALEAEYVLACDGARSPLRDMLGLSFEGQTFEERFLIADIEMAKDSAPGGDTPERHFWFEPTFHPGQSALLHKQPDNIYRIDLQLGWDADPEHEKRPEVVIPRIEKVVGHSDFRLDWVSVYTFRCARLDRFVHDRVIFVGDSAHVVSPFGARGGNGGLQDVDNLGWKLAAVLNGGDPGLIESYDRERVFAADENIANSARATGFMTPASPVAAMFRDEVLALAGKTAFARPMVNSGRLSRPCIYPGNRADDPSLPDASRPGAVAPDAPEGNGWLLPQLARAPHLLALGCAAPDIGVAVISPEITPEIRARYLGEADQAIYLVRPDQVVAGRWTSADETAIAEAVAALWAGQA
ncbi:FAD-dependent monooxygenase [Aestuariibius sp. 2305UL40-4]|uniref:FAD-dependent monooxygenase n=1 Tax=Aestuariibius violaceus TaxID=3234132 RepID=UPI00345E8976